jgi:hypothetical protein
VDSHDRPGQIFSSYFMQALHHEQNHHMHLVHKGQRARDKFTRSFLA